MTDDIDRIVKGLSKAQRASVMNAKLVRAFLTGNRWRAAGGWRTTNILYRHGLTNEDAYLTETGLAVRARLLGDG